MQKLFYFGTAFLILFEIFNVYFIMPMPGSQAIDSINIAYFLYSWRWIFRVVFTLIIVLGFFKSWNTQRKWLRVITLIPLLVVIYLFNFVMVADKMFLQPSELILKNAASNDVPLDRIIIGIEWNGEAKAYPVEYLAYHHQVLDQIGGKEVMVTYCSVCRTGRVFEPRVDGKKEKFRLVGMDHFNAMFEDETTGSWWRQASGEAIAGNLRGKKLPEFPSVQMSLGKWFELFPQSLVMQPDPASFSNYDPNADYEKGESKSSLTGTDKSSWKPKSWVVGITQGETSKAYDWNLLKEKRFIQDQVGKTSILLVLAADDKSFTAFEIPENVACDLRNDTIFVGENRYTFAGINCEKKGDFLTRINAYQEFWHSWQTFHPLTEKFE